MQDHEKLIVIRRELGYESWQDFATKLGYTNKYSYRSIETGSSPLNDNLKLRLAESFNVNPEFMETGKGNVIRHLLETEDYIPPIETAMSLEEMISRLITQNDRLIDTINRNSSIIEIFSKRMSK